MRNQIISYATAPYPVLIEGESGSGKELVAAQLHRLSKKSSAPFLALNCAAISPTLVEPTLFGYSKGAFTGAVSAKAGYFEDAGEGALFLDEIGELPLDLQAKLLRVLENGEYQRVGETQTRKSNARVIAATNRDLRQETHAKRFRSDLYHRLSVFTINVPSLRELGDDRLLLLEFFRDFYSTRGSSEPFDLSVDAVVRWQSYHFPGNVRELRNIVIRLSTKYAGQTVGLEQLEGELDTGEGKEDLTESLIPGDTETQQELARKHLQYQQNFGLDHTLKQWEQSYVEAALKLTHGNVSQAAKLLGINRTTLYSRMEAAEKVQD
jgi:DNA-binding NtrC family response regulator